MRPWVFDGRHRFFAIAWMISNEPPPTTAHDYTEDFAVPTILYAHTMPDSLCRRYGMFTNDLHQMGATGGSSMDVLRFLYNESVDRLDQGLENTVSLSACLHHTLPLAHTHTHPLDRRIHWPRTCSPVLAMLVAILKSSACRCALSGAVLVF